MRQTMVAAVLMTALFGPAWDPAHASTGGNTDPPAVRQPAHPDTSVYMNPFEIIVTASRDRLPLKKVPAAVTVVGPEQLEAMPRGVSIDEALQTVPGVRIDDQMDAERVHVSIRGQGILTEAGVRGIKVLMDGLPLNDPSGVAPDLYDVDWSVVNRAEVIRGPSAALYGGGGSGGVINLTSEDGPSGTFHGGVSTEFGSYNFNKTTATTGGTYEHANYEMSFSRAAGDGYRDHTAMFARNFYEKVHWNPTSNVHLTQIVGWTDYYDENAEGLNWTQVVEDPRQANPDANTYDEYYRTNRFYSGITGRVRINDHHDFQGATYFRMTRGAVSVPDNVAHDSYLTPGFTLQYNYHQPLGTIGSGQIVNHLSAGSDVQWQTFDEYKLANLGTAREGGLEANQRVNQRGVGVFLMDRLQLGQDWGLTASGRYDDMKNHLADLMFPIPDTVSQTGDANFHKATGLAGLVYSPRSELNLFANWSGGFLPPSTEELSNNPDGYGGFNTHLVPATSQGQEVGARGTLKDYLSYDVTGFHLKTENDFDRYRVDSRPLETFYNNVGTSQRYGVEVQLRYHPVQKVMTEVAYTYSHFEYTSGSELGVPLDGKLLPNCPAHMLTVDVEGHPISPVTLGVTCEVQTQWQVDSTNSSGLHVFDGQPLFEGPVDGFTLWGVRGSYEFRLNGLDAEIRVSGRNIFGRKYIAFSEPDPDGNSYQPGPRQEWFGGLSLHL